MAALHPDAVPFIEEWLQENHKRISSFWIGADWNKWARFELFMVLDRAFHEPCLVYHSERLWSDSDEEVDVLLEPYDDIMKSVAIKLRCEKVNENCGSYEDFRDQADADMARLKALGDVDGNFQGTKLLLVGFSGEPSADEHEFKTQPQPKHFQAGEVHGWVMEYLLPPKEDEEAANGAKYPTSEAANTSKNEIK